MTPVTSGVRIINPSQNITLLEWSSTDATICEGSGFVTNNNNSGQIVFGNPTIALSPGQTKDFGIRCQNSAGAWSTWRFVKIIKNSVPSLPSNTDPDAPIIRGADISTAAPVTGITGTAILFTLQATDPDGDNIRYQIDWDNNGSIDESVPGTGYVASAVPQSTNYTWVAGNYSFKVRAQDDNGNYSVWTSHSITVSDPASIPPTPPLLWLEIDTNLVRSGETANFRAKITADYNMPCVVYGASGGTTNFTHTASPNMKTYSYTTDQLFAARVVKIICTPNVPGFTMPSVSDELRINVVPRIEEI